MDIPIKPSEMLDILACQKLKPTQGEIHYISTDSRECLNGDLFISLVESPEKAQAHIREASSKGAITLGSGGDIDVIDAKAALLGIANYYKSTLPRLKYTIAITGSVGKTTTKEFLGEIVRATYKTHVSSGNKNNLIGLPLTILSAPVDTEILVLECGMNHEGEIARLSHCARPDVAVITAVGSAHIGNLGSREAIAKAKCEITAGMPHGGPVICDVDEDLLASLKNRLTFSSINPMADCSVSTLCVANGEFVLRLPGTKPSAITLSFNAPHLIHNLAAATAAAYAIGMTSDEISAGAIRIDANHMRHRILSCNGYTILDDAYNASLESIKAAFAQLKSLNAARYAAVIGDVLELGEFSYDIHRQIGAIASSKGIEKLFLVGEYSEHIKRGAISEGMNPDDIILLPYADNINKLASTIRANLQHGDALLIKASHACGLWRLADLLTGGDDD